MRIMEEKREEAELDPFRETRKERRECASGSIRWR